MMQAFFTIEKSPAMNADVLLTSFNIITYITKFTEIDSGTLYSLSFTKESRHHFLATKPSDIWATRLELNSV